MCQCIRPAHRQPKKVNRLAHRPPKNKIRKSVGANIAHRERQNGALRKCLIQTHPALFFQMMKAFVGQKPVIKRLWGKQIEPDNLLKLFHFIQPRFTN